MTIYIILPFLVCVIGLLMWAICSRSEKPNSYLIEIGRVMYMTGLLVTLFECAAHVVAYSPELVTSIPFLVCVIGLLVWVLASNGVTKEAGRLAFVEGMLVSLFEVGTHVVKF